MIVTITPTPVDGTVLRWYAADDPADVPGHRPVMSVSSNRVRCHDEARITPDALRAAAEAHAELKTNRLADVRRYATHYRTRRGLVPVKAGE